MSKKPDPFIEYCLGALKEQNYYFYTQTECKIDNYERFASFDALMTTVGDDTENTGVKMFFCDSKDVLTSLKHALQILEQNGNMLVKVSANRPRESNFNFYRLMQVIVATSHV